MENKRLTIVYREQPFEIDYFLRQGRIETILYIQGLGCSKNDFAEAIYVPGLQSCTLVAFDFPGCGNSPYPDNVALEIDELVEITNSVISKMNLRDLIIIGHSMGGLVALLYAEKYAGYVKGFINVEGNLAPEDCFFSREIAGYGQAGFTNRVFEHFKKKLVRSKSKGIR